MRDMRDMCPSFNLWWMGDGQKLYDAGINTEGIAMEAWNAAIRCALAVQEEKLGICYEAVKALEES